MSWRSIGNGCSSIPEQGVAAVNQLVIPAGTPVEFRLTSATVMNSFFVPQLGSQIYTMGGMTTHLSLLADEPGEYPGFSANFSGDGFSWMRFIVKSVPAAEFNAWIEQARGAGTALDDAAYAELAKPSKDVSPSNLSLGRARSCSSASSTRRRQCVRKDTGRRGLASAAESGGRLKCWEN